jgi:2-polyprenyl-3-methyl-5-hydroxy-6-metoxy-1,4-benzoquinol methylase
MPDFSRRSTETEIMDDLSTPEKELLQNLREFEVFNGYLGGYGVIGSALGRLKLPKKRCDVLDLGSGGGDTLRYIARWMQRRGMTGRLTGVDYNPVMTRYAAAHPDNHPNISYQTLDIFDELLNDQKADVVLCSLFCHHFEHEALVRLVRRTHELCAHSVVINDLHRHWFAYYSIMWLTRMFSKTYVVKNDACASVARAFVRGDWDRLMGDAGIKKYTIRWMWAFRWQVIIPKQQLV